MILLGYKDGSMASTVEIYLRACDIAVEKSNDTAWIIAAAAREDVDLIVLDIDVRPLGAIDLFKKLKHKRSGWIFYGLNNLEESEYEFLCRHGIQYIHFFSGIRKWKDIMNVVTRRAGKI